MAIDWLFIHTPIFFYPVFQLETSRKFLAQEVEMRRIRHKLEKKDWAI